MRPIPALEEPGLKWTGTEGDRSGNAGPRGRQGRGNGSRLAALRTRVGLAGVPQAPFRTSSSYCDHAAQPRISAGLEPSSRSPARPRPRPRAVQRLETGPGARPPAASEPVEWGVPPTPRCLCCTVWGEMRVLTPACGAGMTTTSAAVGHVRVASPPRTSQVLGATES
ncbi:hypothetical protein HJG60_008336 [Phyllostomus discolor]|uniref:Uncharacterized protein n=1 Tax=Phyllostomus discolor TaxID=89673 RepID=A0A833Z8L6_9CHIR|nr:hypothetical protein HJG60_008336 [Phyllostomus discolor]